MERMAGHSVVLEGAGEAGTKRTLGSLDTPNTVLTAEEAVYDGGLPSLCVQRFRQRT